MMITDAVLFEIARNVRADWKQGLDWKPPVNVQNVLFWDVPSAGSKNFYYWLNSLQAFREWVGERVFADVTGNKFEVSNRTFEGTDSIGRNDILDDNFGMFGDTIRIRSQLWQEAKWQWVVDVLCSNPLTFTGKEMCSTGHKYGKQSISNMVTTAFDATPLNAAIVAAGQWKFSNGVLIRPRFTHFLHGPALRAKVAAVFKSPYTDNNFTANPNYNALETVELKDLCGDYANYWYLIDASQPIKPICRQVREEASPIMDTRPEQVERTGRFDVLATGRGAASPTFPHLIYGGLVAAS